MKFCVLASGSNANCTYVEGGGVRLLIDCGLSGAELVKRLEVIGISPESLDAIIVTHEHSDHIAGIPVVSSRYTIPVYASDVTARRMNSIPVSSFFSVGEDFEIGRLRVQPFAVPHDAADPCGLTFECDGVKFGQATDLGMIPDSVYEALGGCHALVMEFNHDEDLLWSCGYPWPLKRRIASKRGHLSNGAAASFVSEIRGDNLQHLVLAHLSAHSNTPDLAMETLGRYLEIASLSSVVCGSRHGATGLIDLDLAGKWRRYDSEIQPS